jgi:RNA polymerase sigma-70 factor (ECF subfamily)
MFAKSHTPRCSDSDSELIAYLQRGNLRGYEAIFHKYYDLFLTFAQRIVGDKPTAEDIVQDTFMQLWIHRAQLDTQRSLYNLLFTMIKHRVYDYFRHKMSLEVVEESALPLDGLQSTETVTVEEQFALNELRRVVDQAVTAMPSQRQAVYVLSREEHLSRQEIAQRMGLSVRTVDKHLELAMREIRIQLKGYC